MSGRRCDVSGIGQRSKRILRGKPGNVIGRLNGLLDCRSREVRGAGIASALADKDRDAQRFVAVSLYVFELAFAYRDTQATALGGLSGGVAGAEDVQRLAQLSKAYPNLVGAIVGKALYEGRCDVAGLLVAARG